MPDIGCVINNRRTRAHLKATQQRFRVAILYGTRPEAIKMAPLIRELKKIRLIEAICISTQQHSLLLSETLGAISIKSDIEIKEPDKTSMQGLVSSILLELDIQVSSFDLIVVQGDTISAFAGALTGFLQRIPVVHLEAGLRTSDLYHPHPEEGLRRAITHLASLHLAPTQTAKKNLEAEGIPKHTIFVVGNTSIDSIKDQLRQATHPLAVDDKMLRPYCVLTVHRRENWGGPMVGIAKAVVQLAENFPHVDFICPLHPNPVVRETFSTLNQLESLVNLKIVDPIAHDQFVNLLARSQVILTDSGGIQEEATVLGVPVVILREETERPEVLTAGIGFIAGTDQRAIVEMSSRLLQARLNGSFAAPGTEPFGDGKAGLYAARAICEYLGISDNHM